jgi:hypothetical protein
MRHLPRGHECRGIESDLDLTDREATARFF